MKKYLAIFCLSTSLCAYADNAPFNMAYVEVSSNKISTAGCYIRTDNNKPFFDFVSVFAGNINGLNPNKPEIYLNPHVDAILNSNQISTLQNKGIKVLLTLVGNHQNAGWSCMSDENAIKLFANDVVNLVNQYHLDGIDIDDEYSRCGPNNTSVLRIAEAIKSHPGFKGKILSKALYSDQSDFGSTYNGHKLTDFLDYGWEMTYDSKNYADRLSPYAQYGFKKSNLSLGVNADESPEIAKDSANYILQNNYGGIMIYDVNTHSRDYLTALAQVEFKTDVNLLPNCE